MVDLFCPWDALHFDFSENVRAFTTHMDCAASAILLGFLFIQDQSPLSRILLGITTLFSTWVFLDIAFGRPTPCSLCLWSAIILVEVLVFALAIYFCKYSWRGGMFLQKKHLMFTSLSRYRFVPTKFNLSGIEIQSCLAIESSSLFTTRIFETLVVCLSSILLGTRRRRAKT